MATPSAAASAFGLGLVLAGVLIAGCGGSSSTPPTSPTPLPTATPSTTTIVSGGRFTASGSKGVTFTFAVGAGVAAGETVTVSALPTLPPCSGTGCSAVQPPFDGFQFSVGPQPVAVDALTSVALTGVSSPSYVSVVLQDASDFGAFTNFLLIPPAGGPLTITDPASARLITTLAPAHTYAFAIYLFTGGP